MKLIEPATYRAILGQYPTGVCLVTAMQPDGVPVGMIVGSFTSVSLDPPLVAYLPTRTSYTWALLQGCDHFCVNILSAEQEGLCRKFASRDPDKFSNVSFRLSPGGAPIIEDVVGWIDCTLERIEEAGDHDIAIGLVHDLDVEAGGLPLLFFQGGYGRFTPSSLVASDTQGLLGEQLRIIDCARPEMEAIARELSAQCVAFSRASDDLIVAASAGQPGKDDPTAPVGQRVPFAAPLGSVFATWLPANEAKQWIGKGDDEQVAAYQAAFSKVRERGFAVDLLSEAPSRAFTERLEQRAEAREIGRRDFDKLVGNITFDPAEMAAEPNGRVLISVPIFDAAGRVVLSLALIRFAGDDHGGALSSSIERLLSGARRVTNVLGGIPFQV